MPSEYKIRIVLTRDLNSDTTVAFSKWPDLELPEALKNLASEDLKNYCEDMGGSFLIETVHIPNSIEEDVKNEDLNNQYKVAMALLESASGTAEERKTAIDLILKVSKQLNLSVDKITLNSAGKTFSIKETEYKKVIDSINSSQPIEGIKILRETTGYGLKECKDIFDEIKKKISPDVV